MPLLQAAKRKLLLLGMRPTHADTHHGQAKPVCSSCQAVDQAAAAEGGQARRQARVRARVAGMLLLHIHLRAGRRRAGGAFGQARGQIKQGAVLFVGFMGWYARCTGEQASHVQFLHKPTLPMRH
jgi:hypothetical protein